MRYLYTAIFSSYDNLQPVTLQQGWRALCFTDSPNIQAKGWEVIHTDPSPKIFRKIKICPHLFLPEDHELSMWIDGNITPRMPLNHLVNGKTGYWLMNHPHRRCTYQEAERCKQLNKDDPRVIDKQIARYREEGYPEKAGMVATGVLIRTPGFIEFSEMWWDEVRKGSVRDQISWNYCQSKTGIKFRTFPFLQGFKKVVHSGKR